TLDLPEPFGPTTQVIPGSRLSVVADANDLKPRSVSVFRCTVPRLAAHRRRRREVGAAMPFLRDCHDPAARTGRLCHGGSRRGAPPSPTRLRWQVCGITDA